MRRALNEDEMVAIREQVALYDNVGLLNATVSLASGDDYDGCFTTAGTYEFKILRQELARRLKDAGFIEGRDEYNMIFK